MMNVTLSRHRQGADLPEGPFIGSKLPCRIARMPRWLPNTKREVNVAPSDSIGLSAHAMTEASGATKRHRRFHPAVRAMVLAVTIVLATGVASAHAQTLMDAYRQAIQTNPVLQQAQAQNRIGKAGVAQSRALLLPHISASVGLNDSHGTATGPQWVQTPSGPLLRHYSHTGGRSRTDSIALQQVLFDYGDFAQLKASRANAASTAAQLESARQSLMLRVARAYFAVLGAQSSLKFAKANAKALQRQLDQAKVKYKTGATAITDVADAKAEHASATAEVISARNVLFNAREALARITGQPARGLARLTDELPLRPPQPDSMNAWVKTALTRSPLLAAQRDLVRASKHRLGAARAQRLPTLDASISYSRTPQWGGERPDSRRTGTTVGLVLNIPLFTGGAIRAQAHRAIAERDQANGALEQRRRATVSDVRNAFKAIKAGISSVQAEQQAVAAAKIALASTRAGYRVGTQTIVNVLIAQENYFHARSARSQSRHALVINKLNLKFAAGTLSVRDLKSVNALLQR